MKLNKTKSASKTYNYAKKLTAFFALIVFAFIFFDIFVFAQDNTADSEILNIGQGVPEEIYEDLPSGILSGDYDTVVNSYYNLSDPDYIYKAVLKASKNGIISFLQLCASLIGLVILASVINVISESFVSQKTKNAFSLCTDTAIFAAFVSEGYNGINEAIEYIENLNVFITGVTPATAALYASGGNIKTALVSTAGFMTFLAVSNGICNVALRIVSSFCLAMTLCTALAPEIKFKNLIAFAKKTFVSVLGFIMMLLLFSMSAQNILSAASDSVSARTAKFVVSNIIPVVGGSVSDTIRTLSTSISFLRKTVGIGAIIVILIMFIPHIVGLFLTRSAYNLSGAIADILGCEKQGTFMREIGGIYGYIIAVTSMCSIMFIFALTLFAGSAVAVGG